MCTVWLRLTLNGTRDNTSLAQLRSYSRGRPARHSRPYYSIIVIIFINYISLIVRLHPGDYNKYL